MIRTSEAVEPIWFDRFFPHTDRPEVKSVVSVAAWLTLLFEPISPALG